MPIKVVKEEKFLGPNFDTELTFKNQVPYLNSSCQKTLDILHVVGHTDWRAYWAIQAGLLTPLTFAQHRLSPLAAFTSGSYFPHNGRR